MSKELKPCPACTDTNIGPTQYGWTCVSCGLAGPDYDKDGTKWNALPRREDADALRAELAALKERDRWRQAPDELPEKDGAEVECWAKYEDGSFPAAFVRGRFYSTKSGDWDCVGRKAWWRPLRDDLPEATE